LGGRDKLLKTAKSAVVYERSTGTLLYAYNIDQRIYPSSMVKLMTALVALEHGQLSDMVTVTQSALNKVEWNSVSVGLKAGEELTLEALLYCMIVASANDAAVVIAEYIGGNLATFIAEMNDMAIRLGCEDTHFSNVTGLHDDDTYTTTRDTLRILETGLQNEDFRRIFQTASYSMEATNKSPARTINTTNDMMRNTKYRDDRVTGGKTGATSQSGRCLAVTANVGNMELVTIVMGADALYEPNGISLKENYSFYETRDLLNYAQKNFACNQLFYAGQVIDSYHVVNGSNEVAATPAEETRCVLPLGLSTADLTWSYDRSVQLTAPLSKGQKVTQIAVWLGNICLAVTDLQAMMDVGVYTPYQHNISNAGNMDDDGGEQILAVVLSIVGGLAVLILIAMLAIRAVNTAMIKARVRRRRRNRRRNRHA
jgi:D-alanyl-D-alanine carboxypeptidase